VIETVGADLPVEQGCVTGDLVYDEYIFLRDFGVVIRQIIIFRYARFTPLLYEVRGSGLLGFAERFTYLVFNIRCCRAVEIDALPVEYE